MNRLNKRKRCVDLALGFFAAIIFFSASEPGRASGSVVSPGPAPAMADSTPFANDDAFVPKFSINRFLVDGNTVLGPNEIAELVKPFTGAERDFGAVQQALESLEGAYRGKGYNSVIVVLPEQEMKNGEIVFKVIEPRIKSVSIEGNRNFSAANIENSLPSLKKGAVPRIHDVSRNLRVVNENPAKKATLQLRNSGKEDEIDALLKINDDKFWKAGLTFDNTGNSATGGHRLGFLGQYFNLFNLDHVITAQYVTSPDKTDKISSYSASYRLPIYRLGDSIDIFGGYSDVDTGTMQINLGAAAASFSSNITSSGKGIVSGVRYNYNLRRFGGYEHKLVAGLDYRRYDQKLTMNIQNITSNSGSSVAAHPFSLTYNGSLAFERGETGFYLGAIRNDPWGEKGGQPDFDKQPGMPPAGYTIFRFGAYAAHLLPGDWQARMNFNGQYTENTLISGEQAGFGGSAGGRGYQEREASGDQGYSGSVEIYTPDLAHYTGIPETQLRLVGFYDDSLLFKNHPLTGEDDEKRITGIGAGARLSYSKYFSFAFDWGYALSSLPGDDVTKQGGSKVHFRAMLTY